ncbi:uncharacterized protein PHACADRAFT_186712 [Phanerochaete carnosa HHB-10118-sp]|uniref:Uncharacterized protein n=1 Tax=Phanerochaete carnosa (strain HHB-10118-sp) TaxID=650164 RepID=K5WQG0_PHACS|nr:uncharacterized protein PHACADRAFT_186712 [Phanerochaete carnosa HHB-10118-sp]EKM52592.1 hypothetical protein PHACADRAFT_186712 [Phanerochaete carnosa HHB-10118-sp]
MSAAWMYNGVAPHSLAAYASSLAGDYVRVVQETGGFSQVRRPDHEGVVQVGKLGPTEDYPGERQFYPSLFSEADPVENRLVTLATSTRGLASFNGQGISTSIPRRPMAKKHSVNVQSTEDIIATKTSTSVIRPTLAYSLAEELGTMQMSNLPQKSSSTTVGVMHKPRMSVVPDELYQATVDDESLRAFFEDKKLMLVMESFICDGYFLYLSSKKAEIIYVSLNANASITGGPSAGAKASWAMEGGSGTFRRGYRTGTERFTPLYCLKVVQPPPGKRGESHHPNLSHRGTPSPLPGQQHESPDSNSPHRGTPSLLPGK